MKSLTDKQTYKMKKQKRGKKEVKAFFIIANLIIAMFAFSWNIGAADLFDPTSGVTSAEDSSTVHIEYTLAGGNAKDQAPPPSKSTIPPGVAVNLGTVDVISTGGASGSSWVMSIENGNILFNNIAQDKIKVGTEGINLATGEKVKITELGELKSATNVQSIYGTKILDMGGSTGKTTLANVLGDPQLKSQLANNPNLWGQLDGVKKVTKEGNKLIFDYGKGKIVSIDGENIVSTPQGSSMLSQFFGAAGGTGWDALLTGVEYAGLGWGAGQLIGSMAGMDEEQTKALSTALSMGSFTAKSLLTLQSGTGAAHAFFAGDTLPFGIGKAMLAHPYISGLIVGAIVYALLYKKESKEVITFSCKPWQAPVGGGDCEKCNDENGICSDYRCKSLGQSCQLLNVGSKQEKCAWVNPKDTKSPGISPWEDVLTEGYKYTDVRIRPPGEGSEPGRMKIVKTGAKDGCVEAFTPLEFGIVTTGPDGLSEPAQCKIDYNHTLKFDDMAFFFGESNLYLYNHSQKLVLPGPSAINAQAPELQNDGTYTLYVRCKDANGNENVDEFAIRFCVEKGPDTTPPKIEGTSIGNNMPIKYNQTSVELEVYVNEPAECKWSREDRSYSNMENSMTCSKNVWEMNNNMVYTCKTTLTGIKDRQNNVFYFRCKDQPWANESSRYPMQESYKFTLVGTEPLNIIDIKPNGTIYGSTDVVSVWFEAETANGYKNGEAICYYSETGKENDFIEFFETGTELHKQRLDLVEGSYKYYIKCLDLGGNRDDNFTEFKVEVDREAPIITRVYRENELLKIATTEESECRYDIKSCNFKFEDGIDMPYANSTSHFAEWKTENTYFIRCSDKYGNMPLPNTCSIIVRPYDVVEQKVEE